MNKYGGTNTYILRVRIVGDIINYKCDMRMKVFYKRKRKI